MTASAERPYLDKTHPATYKALIQVANTARTASQAAGLSVALLELVNVRASQLNGCVTCLSIHLPAARDAGVPQTTLDLLTAWRQAAVFTPAERAALALTEALTTPHATGPDAADLDAVLHQAAQHFTTDQIAALEWGIVTINAFNRVSIASGHPARAPRTSTSETR